MLTPRFSQCSRREILAAAQRPQDGLQARSFEAVGGDESSDRPEIASMLESIEIASMGSGHDHAANSLSLPAAALRNGA